MKSTFFHLLAVVYLTSHAPGLSSAGELADHPEVDAAIRVLDVWIQEKMIEREQPGLSIGIVHDQQLVWAKGYGYADLEKKFAASPTTTYRIASISKCFTATAIMQLRDAGKLQLDDPVSKHLPWFETKNLRDDVEIITIRHLLTHTSGMPREVNGASWNEYTFPDSNELMDALPRQATVYRPESVWKYSNLAYSIAGEIVTKVSGEPWHEYVNRHILTPLEMTQTRTLPKHGDESQATGYGRRPKPGAKRAMEPFVELGSLIPAGNLTSSVEDLAIFASLQFRKGPREGSQVLKGTTLAEMHRVHWLRPDWKNGWGLGFAVWRENAQTRVGHGGSLPGYRSSFDFVPDKKIAVIALTNSDDGSPSIYADQAFSLLVPAIDKAVEKEEVDTETKLDWQRYLGQYSWKHSRIHVMMLRDELCVVFPTADDPWESRWTLQHEKGHSFRVVPAKEDQELPGELLSFQLDESGKATRLGFPHFYWLRD